MATAIVGHADVGVATDGPTRRSLSEVGKVAATVGNVIHLARPIDQIGRDVVAHELTHVGHPSPEPRFFDDDRRGPEERRADAVAKLMRSTTPRTGSRIASDPAPISSGGTISAEALAARITTTPESADATAGTIRRWRRGQREGAPTIGAGRTRPVPAQTPSAAPQPAQQPAAQPDPPAARVAADPVAPPAAPAAPDLASQFDRIVEMLEERVLTELERRGGRLRRGW